jgi:hypothetical protein
MESGSDARRETPLQITFAECTGKADRTKGRMPACGRHFLTALRGRITLDQK